MNISPGPSNLYVMARAIAQGTKRSIVAAIGLAVGSMFRVVATVFEYNHMETQKPFENRLPETNREQQK